MNSKLLINPKVLAQLFTCTFFQMLGENTYHDFLYSTLKSAYKNLDFFLDKAISDILIDSYRILTQKYRYEYIYKNTILNKLFLPRHNLDTSYYGTEFRCGSSRADVITADNTITIYEIKTEYDSFDKLVNQLNDYHRIADKIYLVTTKNLAPSIKKICHPETGIIVLTDNLSLNKYKIATSNKQRVDPSAIFDCMRQNEYSKSLHIKHEEWLDTPNAIRYKKYKDIFSSLKPIKAHANFLRQLKKRKMPLTQSLLLPTIPAPLKGVWVNLKCRGNILIQIVSTLKSIPFSTKEESNVLSLHPRKGI